MSLSKPISEQNIILITKPEQSGKTFIMLEEINKLYKYNKFTINIIICDNNLMLVNQTSIRCDNKGFSHYELSSKNKKTNCEGICGKIILENKPIILCNNKTRLNDINIIINYFLSVKEKHNINYFFNIWIDEADKSYSSIEKNIYPLINKSELINIYLLTATPNKIINKCKEIKVFPLKESILPTYHGWNDNKIIKIEKNFDSLINYIKYILDNHNKEIQPNTRWFIPGTIYKTSHININNLCKKYGFNILIINGDGAILYNNNNNTVMYYNKNTNTEELIKYIYIKNKLDDAPFVITGHMCISRGITINTPMFRLTHAIMPNIISNNDDMSQIAGRMKGNMKGWDNYENTIPTIFCTQVFDNIVSKMEEDVKNIAVNVYKNNKTTVRSKIFEKINSINIELKKYKKFEDAKNNFMKDTGAKKCNKPSKKRLKNGFYACTFSGIIDERKKASIKSINDLESIKDKIKLRLINKNYKNRLYPLYEDINDNTTLTYVYIKYMKS